MRHHEVKPLFVVSIAWVLAGPARADTLIATQTQDQADATTKGLLVHRVAGDRVTKVFEEKGKTSAYAYAFAGTTLWVVRGSGASATIAPIAADGTAGAAKPLPLADWKLAKDPELPEALSTPEFVATRDGQLWLARCTAMKGAKLECTKRVYLRIDDGSRTVAATPPKNIQPAPPPAKAIAKAPAGYTIKLAKKQVQANNTKVTIGGADCQGPSGKLAWPEAELAANPNVDLQFRGEAKTIAWISATPAVARVTLVGHEPMDNRRFENQLYVVNCQLLGSGLDELSDGGWLLLDPSGDGYTVLRADATSIGRIPGSDARVVRK